MSDLDKTQEQLDQEKAAALAAQELEGLKAKATTLGIPFHPAIGADKLRAKISEFLAADNNPAEPKGMPAPAVAEVLESGESTPVDDAPVQVAAGVVAAVVNPETDEVLYKLVETDAQKKRRIRLQANELVRIRVGCMNPAKKDWEGEIFTVGNSAVGTLKRFVPFNNEEGWHVPRMILDMMQARQCQVFVTKKAKNGIKVREGKLIKEFNIEILPSLDEDELKELARRQAMAATGEE